MTKQEILKELINLQQGLITKSKMQIFNQATRDAAKLQADFVEGAVEILLDGLDLKICGCGEVFERRPLCYFGSSDFCETCVARHDRQRNGNF